MEELILGTEAKVRIEIKPISGVSADEFEWSVELYTNPKKRLTISKYECSPIEDTDREYFVPFDTANVGVGELTAEIVALVHDPIFKDDELRIERVRIESIATIIP
jgi:hypothetical protein